MSPVKTEVHVQAVEISGETVPVGQERPTLKFLNHWNRDELVVVHLPDGSQISMLISELERALRICSIAHR